MSTTSPSPGPPSVGAPRAWQNADRNVSSVRNGLKMTVPAPPLAPSTIGSPVPPGLVGWVGPDSAPQKLFAASERRQVSDC